MALGEVFPLFLGMNAIHPRCGLCPKNQDGKLEGFGMHSFTPQAEQSRDVELQKWFGFVEVTVLP